MGRVSNPHLSDFISTGITCTLTIVKYLFLLGKNKKLLILEKETQKSRASNSSWPNKPENSSIFHPLETKSLMNIFFQNHFNIV